MRCRRPCLNSRLRVKHNVFLYSDPHAKKARGRSALRQIFPAPANPSRHARLPTWLSLWVPPRPWGWWASSCGQWAPSIKHNAQVGKKSKKTGTPPSASQAQRCRPHHGSTQGAKSRSRRTSRTSTGGPCLGARGKQAQLAQANGSKFNLLLMLVAQMSTYPRAISTHSLLLLGQQEVQTHPRRSNCF